MLLDYAKNSIELLKKKGCQPKFIDILIFRHYINRHNVEEVQNEKDNPNRHNGFVVVCL